MSRMEIKSFPGSRRSLLAIHPDWFKGRLGQRAETTALSDVSTRCSVPLEEKR